MKLAEISNLHDGYPMSRSWVCDFCHVASFPSFTEASRHEMVCQQRSLTLDYQHQQIVHDCTPQDSFSLSIPNDVNNLSDRQCFIRSHFIEAFIINASHMRCIKGASKLNLGQVGLRCKFCYPCPSHERADRSVCFPSSISRLYQAVADMQRFHFNKCHTIPPEIMAIYNQKKTTRPRGQGSPQSYWVVAAAMLNLSDSNIGIILKGIPQNMNMLRVIAPIKTIISEEREGGRESRRHDFPLVHKSAQERSTNYDHIYDAKAIPSQPLNRLTIPKQANVIASTETSCAKQSDESDVSLILLSLKASRS